MKLKINLIMAFIMIGLTISLSSVAFAQNSKKKKSNTPPAPATSAKAVPKTSTTQNLSGGDDPENTQRSSKAANSTNKTAGFVEYEEIAVAPNKTSRTKGNKSVQKTSNTNTSKPQTNNIVTNWDDMEKVKGTTPEGINNANSKSKTNNLVFDAGDGVKTKDSITKTTNLSGLDDPDGLQPQTLKINKETSNFDWEADEAGLKTKTLKATKKTSDFQTTSEDLQTLKAAKKTNDLSGGDDPIGNTNRSSKAPETTNSKTKNAEFATFPSDVVDSGSKKDTASQIKAKPKAVQKSKSTTLRKRKIN